MVGARLGRTLGYMSREWIFRWLGLGSLGVAGAGAKVPLGSRRFGLGRDRIGDIDTLSVASDYLHRILVHSFGSDRSSLILLSFFSPYPPDLRRAYTRHVSNSWQSKLPITIVFEASKPNIPTSRHASPTPEYGITSTSALTDAPSVASPVPSQWS